MRITTLNLLMLTKIDIIEFFIQMYPEKPTPVSLRFEIPDITDEQIRELIINETTTVNNIVYNLKPFQDDEEKISKHQGEEF